MKTSDILIGRKKAVGFDIDLNGVPLLVARGDKARPPPWCAE